MHIGKRCGKIIKITHEKIMIEEKHITPRGGFEVREVELKLRDKME
jgi:Fe2+ or Zn2+ uptake regulation protein